MATIIMNRFKKGTVMKWLKLIILFPLSLIAIDAEKKSIKQQNNVRIHAKKPHIAINTCDKKILSLTAQLYEEVLLLRAQVKELRRQLSNQNSRKKSKTDGELFAQEWIA